MKIPRWLKIQEQVDYYTWELSQMLEAEKRLNGIERMIDEATGFDKKKMAQAKKIMTKINKLKEEYKEIINDK
jgi:hypothetical protein